MPTQTEQINDLITATTGLKTTFETKRDDIVAAVDDLNTSKANIVADEVATAASRVNVEADETAVAASKATVDGDAAAIATAIVDINNAITPKIPYTNLIADAGRYTEASDKPHDQVIPGAFTIGRTAQTIHNGWAGIDG